jgi:uncharacterized protein YndB with AHSA1/START domain
MKSKVETGANRVRITRGFDAPRDLVFAWWAQAEKLRQWFGCKDAMQCEIEMDFRVGGSFRQKMQIRGAGEFQLSGTYLEIVEPERIVYDLNFGTATSRITVEFFDEGAATRMVLTQEGLPDEFTCKMIAQGTEESFEKLDGMLAAAALTTA